jgi:hypothetical protein
MRWSTKAEADRRVVGVVYAARLGGAANPHPQSRYSVDSASVL